MSNLVVNVYVPGRGWYGPAYDRDQAEVEQVITNPDAWDKVPTPPVKRSRQTQSR